MDTTIPLILDDLPDDLIERIKPELRPGERLVWAARRHVRVPDSSSNLVSQIVVIVVCLLLGGFVLAIRFGMFGTNDWLRNPKFLEALSWFGWTPTLLGLFAVIANLADWTFLRADRKQAWKTLYVLTDRRAIIWKPQAGSSAVEVYSYPKKKLANVRRIEFPDGSGQVIYERTADAKVAERCHFNGVTDVRLVEDLVRRILIDSDLVGDGHQAMGLR